MSRLDESKKAFIEERRLLGARAGKEIAENDLEYEQLFKLKEMVDINNGSIDPLHSLCEAIDLTGDEIFGDEYQSERNDPEFLSAFVEAALDVFKAIA